MQAQRRHGDRLLRMEGVVGHGVGLNAAGEPAVTVFTRHPGVRGIPANLDDVPVVTRVTGPFIALGTTDRHRPAFVGVSIGHPDITAGTLGARVKDAQGNIYILSNNHVTAASNAASIGDATLQPGAFDGGSEPDDVIGTLADFEPIQFNGSSNLMDAAISSVSVDAVNGFTLAEGYGAPSTTPADASLGQAVQKFGRTTGLTQGQVEELNVTVNVCYACAGPFCMRCTASATFTSQISIAPGDFSSGGDSGSLIVTSSGIHPVGLLFAGSSTRTLANPIGPVLDRFGVEIDPSEAGEADPGDPDPSDPVPPTASFTASCADLSCGFDASGSTAGDAEIVHFGWDFGDGSIGEGETVDHTYGAGGTYTVTLTVTDADGLEGTTADRVTVSEPGEPAPIDLAVSGYKVRGVKHADLSWSGASSTNVDVYRDGSLVATVDNDGFHTDNTGQRGGASHTYQVCEAESSTCSAEVTATF